jgi:hypothetical protein
LFKVGDSFRALRNHFEGLTDCNGLVLTMALGSAMVVITDRDPACTVSRPAKILPEEAMDPITYRTNDEGAMKIVNVGLPHRLM